MLLKRRAQNRANQRAYRKRKEQQLKELQLQIDDMSQKNDELFCACRLLADECYHLQANQMASGQPLARDSSGVESMVLDIGALAAHRVTPLSTSGPVAELDIGMIRTTDSLWGHYLSEAAWGV
ncbi:hypothetical protein Ct61P_12183 [Colletotrichum tofieldiae]|nr:hypothetical protein Ct61P_12183 [Colletotrichum tofieldiae]